MKRPSIASLVSLFVNVVLSLWLVQQYISDQYFQGYVNAAISRNLPYLILTIGIGGGSGLGYVLLRKRHSDTDIPGRLQKSRPPKQSGPLFGQAGTSLQSKNVPTGAPPGPASKHTAYAVPPLSKSPSPTIQRSTLPTSWSAAQKQPVPNSLTGQRLEQKTAPLETLVGQQSTPQSFGQTTKPELSTQPPRGELGFRPSSTSTFAGPKGEPNRAPISSGSIEPIGKTAPTSQWKPESMGRPAESDKTPTPYSVPFPDNPPRPTSNFTGQTQSQSADKGSQAPAVFQPSKWQPPDPGSKAPQWNDPVPRQGYSPPQKWAPPSVSPVPNPRPQTPMGPLGRPGQTPQGRPLFAGPTGPPRPLAYPGPLRPMPSGGVPGPFRPDQRTTPGAGDQQRPGALGQRPTPPQWAPPTGEKREPVPTTSPQSAQKQPALPPQEQPQSAETLNQKTVSGESQSGEMDWDTALDTILKTLRKDKVEDKP